MFQASGSGISFRYANSAANSGMYFANSFGSYPDPFVDDPAYTTRSYVVYADFCPDAGYLVTATVTPTISPTFTVTPIFSNTSTPTITSTATITMTATFAVVAPDDDAYAFPMPAADNIKFVYFLNEAASEVTVNIFDFAGNFINMNPAVKQFNVSAGISMTQPVDIKRLRPGIYYYLIKAKTPDGREIKIKIKKFIVKR
jgi:hypothetical protein